MAEEKIIVRDVEIMQVEPKKRESWHPKPLTWQQEDWEPTKEELELLHGRIAKCHCGFWHPAPMLTIGRIKEYLLAKQPIPSPPFELYYPGHAGRRYRGGW